MVGPACMACGLLQKFKAQTIRILQVTAVKERLHQLETTAVGGTPEEFGTCIRNLVETGLRLGKAASC